MRVYAWRTVHPDYRINCIESSIRDFHAFISESTRSVMGLIVSAKTRFPRFSSIQPLIFLVLFPFAYKPIIRSATPSARIVSRFLINWGSKLELRSRGVETVTSPKGVWTYFCIFPLRRLPIKGLPAFSYSMALFLILSKSNSSFIKKTVLAKLILYSLLTQFNLHPPYFK